jgi:hypothetical protein
MYIPAWQFAECPLPFLCEPAGPSWPGWLFVGWFALTFAIGLGGTLTINLLRAGRRSGNSEKQRRDDKDTLFVTSLGEDDTILIGDDVRIVVFGIEHQQVRLGIEAPDDWGVRPGEFADGKADDQAESPPH